MSWHRTARGEGAFVFALVCVMTAAAVAAFLLFMGQCGGPPT